MNVCTPEQRRGKIMGLWGSAASAGNIFGILLYTLLTGTIDSSWESILAACALVIITIACLFKLVLKSSIESEMLLHESAISFKDAWLVPGVTQYTIAYCCCKFMNYAWMMWLPFFLSTVLHYDYWALGLVTGFYEFGSIIGAFGGGWISDKLKSRSRTVKYMLSIVTPLTIAMWYCTEDMIDEVCLIAFGLGVSVAGVCYLINSCVSADLAIGKNQIATISGIMDGSASLFTGFGMFFVGYIQQFSWIYVFAIIIVADMFAIITLQIIHMKNVSKNA